MKIKTQVAFVGGVGFLHQTPVHFFYKTVILKLFLNKTKKNVYLNVVHTDFVKCLMLVVHEISL